MTDINDVVTTPAEEVIQPEGTDTPEVAKEPTIAEAMAEKPDVIPKARLDKEIARRKEAEAQAQAANQALADLQAKAASGDMSKAEITSDLRTIADKHGIDHGFLSELATAIKAQADQSVEERLRPLTEREKQAKIDAAFSQGFTRALEAMPEFKDIVNPAVIKTLSLDPSNANKTFSQLISETYGNAIQGKKTIEQTRPRTGTGELDFARAKTDATYFKEVMADPHLKKQYNERLFS